MGTILSSGRYIVLLGVIASLLLSTVLFVLGIVQTGFMIANVVSVLGEEQTTKAFAIASITMADFFLIAAGLYIVGTGLYELFIGNLTLPASLHIKSIDDLKDRIISVVVVVLAVSFLAEATRWDGTTNLFPYGGAIGVVILSLTLFGFLKRDKKAGEGKSPEKVQRYPVGVQPPFETMGEVAYPSTVGSYPASAQAAFESVDNDRYPDRGETLPLSNRKG